MNVSVTYFIDVTSSWCFWAEPAWAELKRRYAEQVKFDWQVALIPPEGLPTSREQCEWFYRRSGTITRSPFMLNPGWLEPSGNSYLAPNLVAEAARAMGCGDDRVRLALAEAAMRQGRPVGRLDEAIAVATAASGLDAVQLRKRAESPEITATIQASTARFHEFKMTQRPAFLMENSIGDRVAMSGTWTVEPLVAVVDSLFKDASDYASYAAHFGGPPAK